MQVPRALGGAKNNSLWQAVLAEQWSLAAADRGFGDIRSYPPGVYEGTPTLHPDHAGIRPVLELPEHTQTVHDLEDLTEAVAVVTP